MLSCKHLIPISLITCIILFSSFYSLRFSYTPLISNPLTDTIPGKDTDKIDVEASFPGGTPGWIEYLTKNLNPNVPVDNGAPEGKYTIWYQFIVDTDGRLSEFKPLTHYGYGMEAEVLRILRKSPPWVPALKSKEPVKSYCKQPVTFMITSDKKSKKKNRD